MDYPTKKARHFSTTAIITAMATSELNAACHERA
jgi:hypothetical protein